MSRAWTNPKGEEFSLLAGLGPKISALQQASQDGASFLVVQIQDPLETARWILASFHAPLPVIPLPASLPAPAMAKKLAQLPECKIAYAHKLPPGPELPQPWKHKPLEQIWLVVFTSGSSGEPKGIAITGASLKASALAQAEHNGSASLSWLLNLPMHLIGGFSVLCRAFFLGTSLGIASSRFNAEETAEWIQSGKVQGVSLVPTTLYRLLEKKELDFSSMKLILLGGGPASPELLAAALARKAPIRLTYGMTEHSSQIATERGTGSGLETLPGVELKLSEDGEITLRSPMLCAGEFRQRTLHPPLLSNGFFATGDLGNLHQGKLQIEGRKSEMIICGGAKIFPLEVERELAKIRGVVDCAVGSVPDPEWGEVLCGAVVEKAPGAFRESEAKVALGKILEPRKIPKRWALLNAIPRSDAGKILRFQLHALLSDSVR